jgi:hypothetical protein
MAAISISDLVKRELGDGDRVRLLTLEEADIVGEATRQRRLLVDYVHTTCFTCYESPDGTLLVSEADVQKWLREEVDITLKRTVDDVRSLDEDTSDYYLAHTRERLRDLFADAGESPEAA